MAGRIIRPGAGPVYRGKQGIFAPGVGRIGGHDASLGRVSIADIFVDSVAGNDSNAGTSAAAPLATLAAAKTAIGSSINKRVALKYGSTFKEEFALTSNAGTKLLAYGTAAAGLPLVDGSDAIPNANFTLAAAQTVTYQANVTLVGLTPGAPGGEQRLVWEDGKFLTQTASIAACEAAAGSFFYSSSSSSTPIVYVHASDGSNVSSNGKIYEFNCRYNCIDITGDGCSITNIRTRRQRNNNGSMNLQGDNGWFYNCTMEDGHKHCSYNQEGGGYSGCTFKNAYNGTSGSPNFLVFNKAIGASKGLTVINCTFNTDSAVSPINTVSSIVCHTSSSGNFGTLTVSGCTHTNGGACYAPQNITTLNVTGDTVTNCNGLGSDSTDASLAATFTNMNVTVTSTSISASSSFMFNASPPSARASVTFLNGTWNTATYEPGLMSGVNCDYTFTNCSLTAADTSSRFPHGLLRTTGAGSTLTVNGTTLTTGLAADSFINMAADTVYAGDNNHFVKTGAGIHFQRANADVATSLALWQAYTTNAAVGHDASSTLV